MNIYDQILKAFQFGGGREPIDYPRPDGDYYYSTNSYILVKIKKELCEGTYEPHKKQPNFKRVFPTKDKAIHLPVISILEKIMEHDHEVTLTGDEAVCDECGGHGKVTWTYEDSDGTEHQKEFDCPICDGNGHLSEKTVSIDKLNISLNGISFNIGHLKTILKCIHSLGVNTAKIVHFHSREPMLIEVKPGIEMLIMSNSLEHQIINIKI